MPNAMELVGNRERKRNVRIREQRMGCSGNGGGSGAWYPFAPGRREKRRAAGQVRLSLARRYNTLDLAGKVSVPRGCGPFGNPGEEERRRLDDGTAASRPGLRRGRFRLLLPAEGSCSLAGNIGALFGTRDNGARHFLRKWYYPL